MEKYLVLNRFILLSLLIPSLLFADGEFGDIPSNTTISPEETICRNATDDGWESCATSGVEESTTVSDTAEIDLTLTGFDITADIVAGSIDEAKLDVSTNASLDLADSALQSESDTLQAVTNRGATTTNTIALSPSGNNDALVANGSGSGDAINITHAGSGNQIAGSSFTVDNAGNISGNNLSGTNTGDQNLFQTISTTSGTSPIADTSADTLNLVAGTGIAITGDSATDSVTISSTGLGSEVDPTLTNDASVVIGDGTSGDTTLTFNGDAGADGAITWKTASDILDLGDQVQIGSTPNFAFDRKLKIYDNGVQYASRVSLIGTNDDGYPAIEFVTDGNSSKRTLIRHEGEGSNDYGLTFHTTDNGTPGKSMVLTGNGNLGIGEDTPVSPLEVLATGGTTIREEISSFSVSDAGNSRFFIGNGTSLDNAMAPVLGGINDNADTTWSVGVNGYVTSTYDATDSSNYGVLSLSAFRTDNASDPANGTLSEIQNRKLFSVSNYNKQVFDIDDNSTFTFSDGTSGDVALNFDGDAGTDGAITYDVSEDDFNIIGGLNTSGKVSIEQGDTGGSPISGVADNLVIEDTAGSAGITVMSPDTASAYLIFSTPTAPTDFYLNFNHNTGKMLMLSNNQTAMTVSSSNNVGLSGVSNPQYDLQVDGEIGLGGPLMLTQNSSSLGATPFTGQLWVKDETPLELWYTDENGTDMQVSSTEVLKGQITIPIGDKTNPIATGALKNYIRLPYSGTITEAEVVCDQSGSIAVDVWVDSYANFPPTDADSITAGAPPTVSTAQKSNDSTLTGWTTAFTEGDYLEVNVDSASTVTFCVLTLVTERN